MIKIKSQDLLIRVLHWVNCCKILSLANINDGFSEFEPTDQYDLYNAFKKAADEDMSLQNYGSFDFEEYYRIWVNEPGYPVLEVDVDHTTGNIQLSQVM